MYWMSWKTQTDGYGWDWCNKWRRLKPYADGDESQWPRIVWHADHEGNGVILYPGKDADAEPISCMRLENIRDGCEDFEYFYLLREKIKEARQSARREELEGLCREAEGLLVIPDDMIEDAERNLADPHLLLDHRTKVAEKLEELTKVVK